jgi:hypothetical protein
LLLLALVNHGRAQNYFTFEISTNGAVLEIPANTLATIINAQFDQIVSYKNPFGETNFMADDSTRINYPACYLGPSSLIFGQVSSFNGFAVIKFETVNTTPSLQGYGVQPNGKAATVEMQTSSDLTTWTTATNGTYPATNSAAFYRLKMQIN